MSTGKVWSYCDLGLDILSFFRLDIGTILKTSPEAAPIHHEKASGAAQLTWKERDYRLDKLTSRAVRCYRPLGVSCAFRTRRSGIWSEGLGNFEFKNRSPHAVVSQNRQYEGVWNVPWCRKDELCNLAKIPKVSEIRFSVPQHVSILKLSL